MGYASGPMGGCMGYGGPMGQPMGGPPMGGTPMGGYGAPDHGAQAEAACSVPGQSAPCDDQGQGDVHTGEVKTWNADRGFGFVSGTEAALFNGKDVFLLRSECGAASYSVAVGTSVQYRV